MHNLTFEQRNKLERALEKEVWVYDMLTPQKALQYLKRIKEIEMHDEDGHILADNILLKLIRYYGKAYGPIPVIADVLVAFDEVGKWYS